VVTASGVDPGLLEAAYAHCERLARAHYENFPVASRLLPASMRPHIAAIYAFARQADDFADLPGIPDDERLRLLQNWLHRLRGSGPLSTAVGPTFRSGVSEDLIFCALGNTIAVHKLPIGLFEDLLSAFRQDVTTTRYARWTDVLDYCRRSANPVGRLVLRVAGYDDPRLDAWSNSVCTALQLTNFWQDLIPDWRRGRLYVPTEDRDRAGARDADLDEERITPEWQSALTEVAARTRSLFVAGRPVCDAVRGRLRWELRLTWLGGMRVLDKAEAAGFTRRPALGMADLGPLLVQAVRWRNRKGRVHNIGSRY
jgi:squalene synthase HpnC